MHDVSSALAVHNFCDIDNSGDVMHRFRLVGAPQLLVADGVPVRLERRDAALLALLLLGVPSSRERLAGLLWPHVTPDKARNSLRQRLHRMRKASGSAVAQDHDTLQLLPDVVEPLEQALEVLHEWPEARIPDLLEDVPYEAEPELHAWINGRRDRWRQTIREHRAALVDAMQQRGQSSEALRHARCLVDEDPSVESSHLRLVRLLYTQGDVQAAVAACQAASQALADAGGLGVELQRLQGLATESLQDSRRRNTGDELPAGLVRPPRLVGRAAEWQRIDVALARGRIVAVLGEAGIGKSRLLQEVAGSRGW
jgi:DNA-binding SARP family transcriptional activator